MGRTWPVQATTAASAAPKLTKGGMARQRSRRMPAVKASAIGVSGARQMCCVSLDDTKLGESPDSIARSPAAAVAVRPAKASRSHHLASSMASRRRHCKDFQAEREAEGLNLALLCSAKRGVARIKKTVVM